MKQDDGQMIFKEGHNTPGFPQGRGLNISGLTGDFDKGSKNELNAFSGNKNSSFLA
ncbi:hypothetical protein [Pedobacter kyonggii]|uniref:hypothetical protein n=1 Tax=Pedobacter kyonggii TaxID=1926871 RepID=UPI0013EEFD98|nr:hypothetical protein [Pedobacter kyonggii]